MNLKIFKTSLSILMVMVMLLLTVGCSIDELGFYSLAKEIDRMNAAETSGIVSVELGSELVKEMQYDTPKEMQIVEDILVAGFDLKYTLKVAKKPLAYELKIDFRKKGETEYKKVSSIVGNDKVIYYNLKDILIFLKPYILAEYPAEEKVINELIAKVEYIQIDLDSVNGSQEYTKELSNSEELTRIINEFTDLLENAYSNYSSDAVTKKGNGYELKLEANAIKPLIIKFAEYTITNIDSIVEIFATKISSMPEKDIAYLAGTFGDSSIDREELLSGLEDFRSKIKLIAPLYIDEMKNDESVDAVFKSIEGSVLSNYVEKQADNNYKSATDLVIKYEDKMLFNLKESAQMKKLDAFAITKPSKSITIDELKPIIESAIPPSVDIVKINLKTKKATVNYSDKKISSVNMPYYTIKGYTYTSLTATNKVLGTQISWDAKKSIALLKKDGKTIELAAKKVNGSIYIKVADLEKIGYSVWSDAKTGEINIKNLTKQSIFQ